MALTVPVYFKLGSEFMPPLDEGTLLYMPTTLPGISVAEATRLLQEQDKILQRLSRSGERLRQGGPRRKRHRSRALLDDGNRHRAEAAGPVAQTASAGTRSRCRNGRWPLLRTIWPDHISTQELIYGPGGLNEALQIPGVSNAWTMPIKARIDMLTTGIRTPLGIKVLGSDLERDRADRRSRSKAL